MVAATDSASTPLTWEIGEIYGIFTGDVGEIHCLGVDALDLLRCFEIYVRFT